MEHHRRRQLDAALSALEGLEGELIHESRIPQELRDYLEARRIEVGTAFSPIAREDLDDLLPAFLNTYASAGKIGEVALDDYLEGAWEALKVYPRWLIEEVLGRFRRGVAGNPAHVPTVPELATDAGELTEPWLAELRDMGRVVHARTYAERARTPDEIAWAEGLVARFKGEVAVSRPVNEELRIDPDAPVVRVSDQIAAATDAHLERMREAFPGESDLAIARRYTPQPRGPGWDSRLSRADGSPLDDPPSAA